MRLARPALLINLTLVVVCVCQPPSAASLNGKGDVPVAGCVHRNTVMQGCRGDLTQTEASGPSSCMAHCQHHNQPLAALNQQLCLCCSDFLHAEKAPVTLHNANRLAGQGNHTSHRLCGQPNTFFVFIVSNQQKDRVKRNIRRTHWFYNRSHRRNVRKERRREEPRRKPIREERRRPNVRKEPRREEPRRIHKRKEYKPRRKHIREERRRPTVRKEPRRKEPTRKHIRKEPKNPHPYNKPRVYNPRRQNVRKEPRREERKRPQVPKEARREEPRRQNVRKEQRRPSINQREPKEKTGASRSKSSAKKADKREKELLTAIDRKLAAENNNAQSKIDREQGMNDRSLVPTSKITAEPMISTQVMLEPTEILRKIHEQIVSDQKQQSSNSSTSTPLPTGGGCEKTAGITVGIVLAFAVACICVV